MKKYDVFISYAIEDKFPTAAGIAERLQKAGLKVYFVGDRLSSGDLISDTVNHGLEQSSFCVLIVSHHYCRKWPAIERNHILHREKKEGKKLVFPVWNNISYEEVAKNFPELIDHYAPTMDAGLDAVANHLQQAIHKRKQEEDSKTPSSPSPVRKLLLVAAGIALLAFTLFMLMETTDEPTDPPMRNTHPLSPDR